MGLKDRVVPRLRASSPDSPLVRHLLISWNDSIAAEPFCSEIMCILHLPDKLRESGHEKSHSLGGGDDVIVSTRPLLHIHV